MTFIGARSLLLGYIGREALGCSERETLLYVSAFPHYATVASLVLSLLSWNSQPYCSAVTRGRAHRCEGPFSLLAGNSESGRAHLLHCVLLAPGSWLLALLAGLAEAHSLWLLFHVDLLVML
ncbi:hypothetical protein OIU79_022255 [Salix purpurea]|uniref:Uncharacterized protein n=1 Tax=Salix purpurea TaxID=77065 RepID=A0A9Q1ACK5_SALPP|nr:hypothetical protein OIU79_022255 [Salix purpurea]